VVVGACFDASGKQAMVWTASDGMRRLIDLVDLQSGWTFTETHAINDAGEITGWGHRYGKERAFLLAPIDVSDDGKPHPKDLVTMVMEILFAGGAMGVLLPSGDVIYPRGGPAPRQLPRSENRRR
jgi:hypothetical protein